MSISQFYIEYKSVYEVKKYNNQYLKNVNCNCKL